MGINVAFPEVGQRQVFAARQMGQEVAQGVKSGAIDSNELSSLKGSANSNLQTVKGYAADGQISGQEQKSIAQMQVQMGKDIFEYKNNPAAPPAETTGATSASATASASAEAAASSGSTGQAAPSERQAGPSVAYPELAQRQVFAARQMFQEVVQGVQSGAIDQNELASLKSSVQGNIQTAKGYAADGQITGEEQKAIAQMQAQTAVSIRQAAYSAPA